jgi:hypothetical protein
MTNKIYEVQTWKYYDEKKKGSEIDKELCFDTLKEADKVYSETKCPTSGGKLLMKYASKEDNADGQVLAEEWSDDE